MGFLVLCCQQRSQRLLIDRDQVLDQFCRRVLLHNRSSTSEKKRALSQALGFCDWSRRRSLPFPAPDWKTITANSVPWLERIEHSSICP
ncbi:hypothetical protein AAC387_Pa10g0111 [Persea americana]